MGKPLTWFERAQQYEARATRQWVDEYGKVVSQRFGGLSDDWFGCHPERKTQLIEWVRDKVCIEVGSSVTPQITGLTAKEIVVIEPLGDQFRDTIPLPENGRLIADRAESVLPQWAGTVDGLILSRNCIDHTDEPLELLGMICDAAAPGCYLCEWSDIWHIGDPDCGHKNITQNPKEIGDFIRGKGFEIIHEFTSRFPDYGHELDFGCLARRKA